VPFYIIQESLLNFPYLWISIATYTLHSHFVQNIYLDGIKNKA
jgi:hypothetical protein